MPWRATSDPYHIVVSEFMLQQTQVSRVMQKFGPFLERFPDWSALASARLVEVLAQWQGLGYNRRAKFLHQCAHTVLERHNGALPADPNLLEGLPGIGRNTAGAVCAFAFNLPVVFIETNIRRVFLHFFFSDVDGVHDRELMPLIAAALDRDEPRRWYWALMDYGAMLKLHIANPNRRSVHYNRQSRFEGSRRQIRGALVRMFSDGDSRTLDRIQADLGGLHDDRLAGILDELVVEGFLLRSGERYAPA
ncbi:MAG: A/G-specific adenine glycosylase [Spirochaetaceae bacterium]|nr:MAG: A/G-specific adenine glycosylase [Spirochaetaceae bacterium]